MAEVMKQIFRTPAAMLTIALLLTITTSTVALNPLKASAAANQTKTNASGTSINSNNSTNTTNTSQNSNQAKIDVVASFYPIYYFTKAVGDDRINLSVLIPFGSEPHDYDPTIQQVQKVNSANLLVYNGASMEEPWIHNVSPQNKVDASTGITLLSNPGDPDIKGPYDPHLWLDPVTAIKEVQNIRDGLVKVDPKNAAYYNQNAQNFIGQLQKLDAAFRGNLTSANCAKRDFIPFHLAFAYFAKQYGLKVHPIHEGLTPNGEVLPQKLVEVVNLAKKLGLKMIYSEDLIDPRSAQAIAEQIPGAKVQVLSPIEGINATEQKAGVTYLDKMYHDLAELKEGLQCKV
jgi:zinc transport system substrate-binding protein